MDNQRETRHATWQLWVGVGGLAVAAASLTYTGYQQHHQDQRAHEARKQDRVSQLLDGCLTELISYEEAAITRTSLDLDFLGYGVTLDNENDRAAGIPVRPGWLVARSSESDWPATPELAELKEARKANNLALTLGVVAVNERCSTLAPDWGETPQDPDSQYRWTRARVQDIALLRTMPLDGTGKYAFRAMPHSTP